MSSCSESKYSIIDTFSMNYDIHSINSITRLYITDKFEKSRSTIEKYKELNTKLTTDKSLTIVQKINIRQNMDILRKEIQDVYNIETNTPLSDILTLEINNFTINYILENYSNDTEYYITLTKALSEYMITHNIDNLTNTLYNTFNIDYSKTTEKIKTIYSESDNIIPDHKICVYTNQTSDTNIEQKHIHTKKQDIYNYIAKIVIIIYNKKDVHKSLKYIRSDIIADYITIAKQYNPHIKISRILNFKNCCYCNIWYKKLPVDENGKHVCPCGFEAEDLSFEYKSDNGISRKSKDNFRKAFNLLQGNIRPPNYKSVVKKLDEYFNKYNIDIKSIVESKVYTENGKIKGTNRDMLITALKKTGYSSHTIYIQYYLQEYFNWNIKKYTSLEEDIMRLYDETISIFIKIKDTDRNSAPNVWYHLLWILLELGQECYIEDFKIPENDSLVELEGYRKKICATRGMKFLPIMSMVKV